MVHPEGDGREVDVSVCSGLESPGSRERTGEAAGLRGAVSW